MLSKEELGILNALRWYFGVLLQKPKLDDDVKNSRELGLLISQLPKFYKDLIYVCGLTNGEAGLTHEKEYEYVGRGFVDPFYRLTHTNDNCFNYVFHTLKEKKKDDFSQINLRRGLTDEIGMKALLPLVVLSMVQHKSLINKAHIEYNLPVNAKCISGKRFIADLSLKQRFDLGTNLLNQEKLLDIYNAVDSLLQEEKFSLSMMVLGGFVATLGIATVAIAFTILDVATFGMPGVILASLGVAASFSGIGLFSTNACTYWQTIGDESLDLSDNLVHQ